MNINKKLAITIKGKHKTWSFNFWGDPKYLDEWRKDGIDVVQIHNTIPVWVVDIGMTRVWCFFQDLFSFKNPFGNKGRWG